MVRSGESVQVRHTVRGTCYAAWHVRMKVFKFITILVIRVTPHGTLG